MPLMISRAEGLVHCDEIGKRVMRGDERSVPVWHTAEDYEALAAHGHWMLRGPRRVSVARSTLTGSAPTSKTVKTKANDSTSTNMNGPTRIGV